MMSRVVEALAALLASEPSPALPANRLADRAPFTPSDLPLVSVALLLEPPRGNGIGGFSREGHQLVRHTGIAEARPGANGFSQDLRSLRLSPLPLKRPEDIEVSRVGGGPYRRVPRPSAKEEFTVEVPMARLRFGAAQGDGDRLQVAHWTLEFRDDIETVRYSGSIALELWGSSSPDTAALARRVQVKLAAGREALRERGFAALHPAALEPAASALQQPGTGSAFPVWKQKLTYRFAFEGESGGEAGGGGPIRRINVDLDGETPEPFSVQES